MLRGRLWDHLSHVDLLNMESNIPSEMDVIISGGGFLGYYLVGVDRVLRKLCREKKTCILHYTGTSVGSLASVAMVCGLGDRMIELYDQLQGTPDFFPKIRSYFLAILPPDAYEKCSHRVHIVISRLEWKYHCLPCLTPYIVSTFHDNVDLVDACMASCSVPYFVSSTLFYGYRGYWCMDGFFTKKMHILTDSTRPQLLVRLHRIPFSWRTVFKPYQNMVLPLIVQGAVDTELFFREPLGREGGALEWYCSKASLNKRRSLLLFYQKLRQSSWVMIGIGMSVFMIRKNFFSSKR